MTIVDMHLHRRPLGAIIRALILIIALPLAAAPALADPIIALQDIDLGEVGSGLVRQATLSICNSGDGQLTFSNPSGSVVTGLGQGFSVSNKEIEKLAAASLGAGECFRLAVTFFSQTPGSRSTTIRIWASTRATRDTAVLRANVTEPRPALTGFDFGPRRVAASASPCTKNTVADYEADVALTNLGSGTLVVDRIELGGDIGAFSLDTSSGANRILRGDIVRPASATDTPRYFQRIRFAPGAAQAYTATLVVSMTDGSVVRSTITGQGLEGHLSVTDSLPFGVVAAGSLPVRRAVTVSSNGNIPVTITGLTVRDDAAFAVIGAGLPLTLEPGATRTIDIELRRASDGLHEGILEITGDFSRCDDSTAALSAVLTGVGAADDDATDGLSMSVAPSVTSQSATLAYTLQRATAVRIVLVDALGRRTTLHESPLDEAGAHRLSLDASALPSGHYTCLLVAGDMLETTRLLIVR